MTNPWDLVVSWEYFYFLTPGLSIWNMFFWGRSEQILLMQIWLQPDTLESQNTHTSMAVWILPHEKKSTHLSKILLMASAPDCPWTQFAQFYCHVFAFYLRKTFLFPSPLSSGAANPNSGLWGFVGNMSLHSPWRGGWEVRGAPLTFSVPHSPECHLKPQYKHKGISKMNSFPNLTLSWLWWLSMGMHGCAWVPRVKQRETCLGFEWHFQVTVFAHVLKLSIPCSSHVLCWVLLNLF